ncbi:MAG: stage 0 sporulation protein [Ruminococcaceae bacterium]|nr:stage 0 sporulation protein [Oscillospiraceae bacterium]
MSEPEPVPELAKYEIVGIRFKAGGKIYYFDPAGEKFKKDDAVIVETARGLEFGFCDIQNRMVTEREVVLPLRPVVRRADRDDIARHEANVAKEKEALAVCAQKILDHKLEMKLIDVEYTFDNSKLLFYFTAEGRVDFRELVKDLAAVFRTRIELRQIGIRDETKLLGGIGICGRPFCCKTFLSDFVQVSIKMAKEQNLSLNSVKISGACGRLMCCLRYEYDTYQEEIRKTPKMDQIVSTEDGNGTVIEVQPLAGLVRVRFAGTDKPPKVFHRDDVKVIGGKGFKPKEPQEEA